MARSQTHLDWKPIMQFPAHFRKKLLTRFDRIFFDRIFFDSGLAADGGA